MTSPSHPPIELPDSYANLPFTQIKLSHYPESSPTPTPIIVLTLYRPKSYNAFTDDVMRPEIISAYRMLDVDPRVKCILFTGYGKMFCAGADLNSGFVGGNEPVSSHRDGGGQVAIAIHNCRKPTIAALNGSAVGVGITMTLPMNIRIAKKDAKVGFVFARRGLVMEACSSFFLPRLIGHSRAMHLVTTGATYPANHKLLEGLFSETYDTAEEVFKRALEIAEEVVNNTSAVSTYLMKELMYRDKGSPEGQHLLDSKILYEAFSSSDNKEGVAAFKEKRQVKFTGTMEDDAPSAYPWWEPVDLVNRAKAKNKVGGPKL